MRIAIVTTQFPALSETFIYNKVKALAAHGHTVQVFTGKKNNTLFRQLFTKATAVSVVELTPKSGVIYTATHPVHLLKSIAQKNKKKYLFQLYQLHFINQFSPDIIHFEFSGVGVEYLNLLSKITCKKVVSC